MNNATNKVRAVKVTIKREEGTVLECEAAPSVFTGDNLFLHADNRLREWRRTAPREGGGYHKVRFAVEYADGETYEGRIDLTRACPVSIGLHMQAHLERTSGRATPPGRTAAQWGAYLRDVVGAERMAAAGAFLDGHAIPGWDY